MRTIPHVCMLFIFVVLLHSAIAEESIHGAPTLSSEASKSSTTTTVKAEGMPGLRRTLLQRAAELVTSGKPEEARALLSPYHPSHEEMFAYHNTYAQSLVQSGMLYDSIEHYRLAYLYAGSPEDQEKLLLERAEVYEKMNYYSEAVQCYEVFFIKFPKSILGEQVRLGLAESLYRIGEYRRALSQFEKAGSSSRALFGKANSLQLLGRIAEAQELYHTLVQKDMAYVNSSPEALYNLGENYRMTGKLSDARICLDSIKEPPLQYKAKLGLGQIALQEGKLDEAVTYFAEASKSDDRNVRRQSILNRADANLQLAKYDESLALLLEIKKNYPYGSIYDSAALMLARLYRKKGQPDEAVVALKELIYRRTPDRTALDELEAMILEAKDKNHEQFVRLWNTAGRWLLDASRSANLIKIARGLRYSGKPFFDVCTWLIKYGPEDAKAESRILLADFYAGVGDSANAASYLRRAKIKRHDDNVLRIKARLFLDSRDYQKTYQTIKAIQQLREEDLLLLLDAMRSMKNLRNVVEFCDTAMKKTGTATTYVIFADILHDAGRKAEALRNYRLAVGIKQSAGAAMDPRSARDLAWAHYRISLLAKGDDAIQSLKAIEAVKDTMGRFAAAELKGKALSERAY